MNAMNDVPWYKNKVRLMQISIVLQVFAILILISINLKLPDIDEENNLFIGAHAEQPPRKVGIDVYNAGDYISNATIIVTLLERLDSGIDYQKEVQIIYTGPIVSNALASYTAIFESDVYALKSYLIDVRISTDDRTAQASAIIIYK